MLLLQYCQVHPYKFFFFCKPIAYNNCFLCFSQGYLDWVHVPSGILVHNVTVPDSKRVYQFAISANTERASSGMMWASCTVIHNRVVGKMKNLWINRIDSTSIDIGWKLECSDRIGIVEGFRIYYCPIVSPYSSNCKGPKLNTTIKAVLTEVKNGIVTGLKPYTTYMFAVAVLTKVIIRINSAFFFLKAKGVEISNLPSRKGGNV